MFSRDQRVLPLCRRHHRREGARRSAGDPAVHQHQSHRRDDGGATAGACAARVSACSASASRSFSPRVLGEFNKAQIHRHIEPMLAASLEVGITPFLDLILSSPRSTLDDVAETLREAHRWLQQGCEIGMYPYVIPFSGAAFAQDPTLAPHTVMADRRVAGTEHRVAAGGEDPADGADRARRHPARSKRVRGHARFPADGGGAPAVA